MGEKVAKKVGYKKLVEFRRKLTKLTDKLIEVYSSDATVAEVCVSRGYTEDSMINVLKEVGVFKLNALWDVKCVAEQLIPDEEYDKEFYSMLGAEIDGYYIESGRYTIPIRDISGEVTAWVGWYPDAKKYITTNSYGFSKGAQFFNAECYRECWEKNNGVVYLVEGIFDTLSLRSLGFSALGNMGIDLSAAKAEMLLRFSKIIVINDNDKVGQEANRYSPYAKKNKVWNVPESSCIVKLPDGVKDADDLIKWYDCYEELKNCENKKFQVKL